MRLIAMLTKRLFYLFYLLTLFNADYKTLAACALIKIDYHPPSPTPPPSPIKSITKCKQKCKGRE